LQSTGERQWRRSEQPATVRKNPMPGLNGNRTHDAVIHHGNPCNPFPGFRILRLTATRNFGDSRRRRQQRIARHVPFRRALCAGTDKCRVKSANEA
jgi:hypothetical protein